MAEETEAMKRIEAKLTVLNEVLSESQPSIQHNAVVNTVRSYLLPIPLIPHTIDRFMELRRGEQLNFSYYDLSGLNFSGIDLSNLNFDGADLSEAFFHDCSFQGFQGFAEDLRRYVNVTRASLNNTIIEGATFNDVRWLQRGEDYYGVYESQDADFSTCIGTARAWHRETWHGDSKPETLEADKVTDYRNRLEDDQSNRGIGPELTAEEELEYRELAARALQAFPMLSIDDGDIEVTYRTSPSEDDDMPPLEDENSTLPAMPPSAPTDDDLPPLEGDERDNEGDDDTTIVLPKTINETPTGPGNTTASFSPPTSGSRIPTGAAATVAAGIARISASSSSPLTGSGSSSLFSSVALLRNSLIEQIGAKSSPG